MPVMKKSLFVLLLTSVMLSLPVLAQESEEPHVKDLKIRERFFVGGFI